MNVKGKSKARGEIAFVTHTNITHWLPDPENPNSIAEFIADSSRQGWPVWYHAGSATVFACSEVKL